MAPRKQNTQAKPRNEQNPPSDQQVDAGNKNADATINATDSADKNTTTNEDSKDDKSQEQPNPEVDTSGEKAIIQGEAVDANQTATENNGTTERVVSAESMNDSEKLHGSESGADGQWDATEPETMPSIVDPVSRPPLPMGTPLTIIDGKTDLSVDPGSAEQIPQEVLQRQAKKEMIHEPTNTRMQPPANPFMRDEAKRKAAQVHASTVSSDDMAQALKDADINIGENYMLRMLTTHLDNYVESMGPNVPISDAIGTRMQQQLAGDIFSALEASPQESSVALKVIEQYFTKYNDHAFSRRLVFRFMDKIAMDHQKGLAFQSLLHLFIELANPGTRKRKEIAREVSIRKIADYMPGNTDAQLRLTEFMS